MSRPDSDKPSPDNDALRDRLDRLTSALDARRPQPAPIPGGTPGKSEQSGSAMGAGLRTASELVTGVAVGGFIGWQLDAWLGTKPWLSIAFFILGVMAGFWNVMRGAFAPTVAPEKTGRDDTSPGSGA